MEVVDRNIILKHIDRVINGRNGRESKNICTVCTVNTINSVFIPCGHQSCCYEWYQRSRQRFRNCPICRKVITNTVRTFMNGF